MPPPDPAAKPASPRFSPWRLAPLGLLAAGFAAFFLLGLDRYVSLEGFRAHYMTLKDWVAAQGALGLLVYALAYALLIAFSVPGGLAMTLAGAMLFGAATAAATVIVAATIGASAVFLAAKIGLGDSLRARAGPGLKKMEAGFRKNAFAYLLALRLMPIFPFWLVNLAPAFFGVPLWTYVLATAIGIAPATAIFATIGSGLSAAVEAGGEIDASAVFTPTVAAALAGLAVLALLPVVFKRWKGRRAGGA